MQVRGVLLEDPQHTRPCTSDVLRVGQHRVKRVGGLGLGDSLDSLDSRWRLVGNGWLINHPFGRRRV